MKLFSITVIDPSQEAGTLFHFSAQAGYDIQLALPTHVRVSGNALKRPVCIPLSNLKAWSEIPAETKK